MQISIVSLIFSTEIRFKYGKKKVLILISCLIFKEKFKCKVYYYEIEEKTKLDVVNILKSANEWSYGSIKRLDVNIHHSIYSPKAYIDRLAKALPESFVMSHSSTRAYQSWGFKQNILSESAEEEIKRLINIGLLEFMFAMNRSGDYEIQPNELGKEILKNIVFN